MNQSSDNPAAAVRAPWLALVRKPLRLAQAAESPPQEWRAALGQLLDWLAVDHEFVSAGQTSPVFAPWACWSPAAFQNGGHAALPEARFVASYCIDHGRGAGADIMLLSPHPATCTVRQHGGDALPCAGVLKAMIRAASKEGRERIAVMVHARHRAAVTGMRLCAPGTVLDVLAIEEALPALMRGTPAWDAIIAMPDLRGIVFAMLAETTGVRGPWPMLWHAGGSGGGLCRVTCEALGNSAGSEGAGEGTLPLDAAALALALALALREAGMMRPARRLHASWARLQGRGVATAGRGADAPYAIEVGDAEFIGLLCRDTAANRGMQKPWHALAEDDISNDGTQIAPLRIVSWDLADS